MYWLDNSTGVTTPPTIPPVQSPVRRYFTEGGQGQSPSTPGGEWFNMVTDELLALLALANITPDKADHSQISKAIQTIAFSAYPVGAPIPWPTSVPPLGFLAMNGQSFNTTLYPKLAIAYPSGVLPDLRATVLRGWDNLRGVDVGRTLLSEQGDAMRNITAQLFMRPQTGNTGVGPIISGTGAFGSVAIGGGNPMTSSISTASNATSDVISFNSSNVVPTASENRVRNTAFQFIVRAA